MGEVIGIGESIQVTVTRGATEASFMPYILVLGLMLFIFLCIKAWKSKGRD